MSNQEHDEAIADELLSLIRPHYKGLRPLGQQPEFKKTMRGDEIEHLLLSIHNIIVRLREQEHSNGSDQL